MTHDLLLLPALLLYLLQVVDGVIHFVSHLKGLFKGRYADVNRQDYQAVLSIIASKCCTTGTWPVLLAAAGWEGLSRGEGVILRQGANAVAPARAGSDGKERVEAAGEYQRIPVGRRLVVRNASSRCWPGPSPSQGSSGSSIHDIGWGGVVAN